MKARSLSTSEITALKNQGCFSSNWSDVTVEGGFSTDAVHQVRFAGKVLLGKDPDLFKCKIKDCEIGDHVRIDDVHLVQNYRIMDHVVLENVDAIEVNGLSSFGNGTEIEVLNEGGGRELLIFDRLTAQLAYLLVVYRHDPDLIKAINRLIHDYARKRTSETGIIGQGTEIVNTGSIHNVEIGSNVSIRGASHLENGTIVSNNHAPVYIGENVIAKNFIVLSGSRLDSGALVEKCFIGQSVEIGKQFSAENSAFFANCEAFHGEAVSVFAGPYTVSHHKSTLLIAGMFSFYNAGSGTNQSNHMYKLGPVHQGIVERGSKTGSFAYLLWPGRIGAYSVVMGKNMASFDTGDFPFSYINVDLEKSFLTPGMNLFTVGTRRDSEKWPARDKRKDPEKADLINFDFLSPYIVQKVIRSLEILTELYEKASKKQDSVYYKGIRIKRLMLKSTRKYYQMALDIFVGSQVVKKLEGLGEVGSMEILREKLSPGDANITARWNDLAGMIAPDQQILEHCKNITSGNIQDLEGVFEDFKQIHASYDNNTWDWTVHILAEYYNLDIRQINEEQLIELISGWETASIRLDKMILNDASKEYDDSSKIGFGMDGDQTVIDLDFEAVRGSAEDNKFIKGIHQEMEMIGQKAATLKSKITTGYSNQYI